MVGHLARQFMDEMVQVNRAGRVQLLFRENRPFCLPGPAGVGPRFRSPEGKSGRPLEELAGIGMDELVEAEGLLAMFLGIDVHHHLSGGTGKGFILVADRSDAQPTADRQEQVTVLHGKIAGPVALVADPANEQGMGRRQGFNPQPAGHHRKVLGLHEGPKLLPGACQEHPLPNHDHRPAGGLQHGRELGFLGGGQARDGRLPAFGGVESPKVLGVDRGGLDIEGDIYPDGAGPASGGKVPGLFQNPPDILRVFDHHRELGHRGHHRDDVRLLHAELAQFQAGQPNGFLALALAGNEQAGDIVLPGIEEPGQRIRSSTAGGDEDRRRGPAVFGIPDRGHGRGLLVMGTDHFQLTVLCQSIGQEHHPAAGNHEGMGDAPLGDELGNEIRNSHVFLDVERISLIVPVAGERAAARGESPENRTILYTSFARKFPFPW